MAEEIQKHRETREVGAFAALFPAKADQFVTSSEVDPLLFDEAKYAPTTVFSNHAGTFKRHYFPQIGDLKTGARNTTAHFTSEKSVTKSAHSAVGRIDGTIFQSLEKSLTINALKGGSGSP